MENKTTRQETAFLDGVTEKLRARIAQLDQGIAQGQKDIENMHEYYWENYTEMDQYGYENFDNQQALLHQVNANQEKQVLKHRLERMLDSPYFGRVDFRYEGEEAAESFRIGIGNFAERPGALPLIYDWRAPVSSLFYDFDKGPASYEAPLGVMEGTIDSKWQYKIQKGKMVYAIESDVKIDDEILKQELSADGEGKLKNIVRTIQREQNAIIRNRKDSILVIQGSAGSGKTSVALHRIAYLLYHDRNRMKSSNVLVLSPNGVFSDYISHILPELGEESIQEMSFDLFAYRELKMAVADCEDRYQQLERSLDRNLSETLDEKKQRREKQSEQFLGRAEAYLAGLEDSIINFRRVEWRKMEMTEQEMIRLFYFQYMELPLMERMRAVMEKFIDEYETLHSCQISEEERVGLEEIFLGMYETRDLYKIYNGFLEAWGYPQLPDVPYEQRMLPYEDVYPMLYLKYRLFGGREHTSIRHLVIDEMQDYSYLQYVILSRLFSCPMTILGDRAQTMDDEAQDVCRFLPKLLGQGVRVIEMKKGYRNTVEIAQYAEQLLGCHCGEFLERHGKPVEEQEFAAWRDAVLAVVRQADLTEDGFETAAVLTMTEKEAFAAAALLREAGMELSYIDRDSTSFKKGLTVTTFYLAKGLEFDQVFAVMPIEEVPMKKKAQYICATRALHQLHMYQYETAGKSELGATPKK